MFAFPPSRRPRMRSRGGGVSSSRLADLRQHVRLAQDEQLVAVDGDLGASVLRVEDLVALAHVERAAAAVLVDGSVADSEHLALLRLLLGCIGEDDPACGRLLLLNRLNDQAVLKRLQLHRHTSWMGWVLLKLVESRGDCWHSRWESARPAVIVARWRLRQPTCR